MAVNHKRHSVKQCGVDYARASPSLETEHVDLVKGGEALTIFKALPRSSHLSFGGDEGKKHPTIVFHQQGDVIHFTNPVLTSTCIFNFYLTFIFYLISCLLLSFKMTISAQN